MNLSEAITRVRTWLAHRQRLREAASNHGQTVWIGGDPDVQQYFEVVTSTQTTAHADAGIEAWCAMVQTAHDVAAYLRGESGVELAIVSMNSVLADESDMRPLVLPVDALNTEIARFIAFASSPLLDVPEVTP